MSASPNKEQIDAIFDKYDINGDGKLSAGEMKKMVQELDITLNDEEFDAVFYQFDSDANGFLDRKEFFHFVYVVTNCDFTHMASMLFYIFDLDHNASIDKHELSKLLLSLGYQMTEEEIDNIMGQIGTRGKMNYQEFLKFVELISE